MKVRALEQRLAARLGITEDRLLRAFILEV
jgi:hypothetical protein